MIRILHIVYKMNPGGVESLLMNLYRNIDRDKYQFDFYTIGHGVFDNEIIKMGGQVYYTNSMHEVGLFKYWSNWDIFLKTHRDMYDVIHCHLNNTGVYMLKIARKNGIKVRICHSHASTTLGNPILKPFRKIFNYIAIKNSTLLLGCSDKANKWLYGNKSKQAYILNNGVDVKRFKYKNESRKKIRKEYNLDEKTMVIGHVGRLVEVKNHKYLLRVFKEYSIINPNSVLMVVGDGDLKDSLVEYTHNLHIDDKVLFLGIKTNVEEYMCCFDSFVFPSFYEGLPVTLIEAQASGLQVLASRNISEMSSVLDTFEFLDIDDNPIEWAKKIKKSSNRDLANKILSESHFNIKKSSQDYMNMIDKALNER